MPAAAPYAARAPAAFPAEGVAMRETPSSLAREMATAMPRALKLPVGFSPSSLIYRFGKPCARPILRALSKGVPPSPRVTTFDSLRAGSNLCQRHRVEWRLLRSAGDRFRLSVSRL